MRILVISVLIAIIIVIITACGRKASTAKSADNPEATDTPEVADTHEAADIHETPIYGQSMLTELSGEDHNTLDTDMAVIKILRAEHSKEKLQITFECRNKTDKELSCTYHDYSANNWLLPISSKNATVPAGETVITEYEIREKRIQDFNIGRITSVRFMVCLTEKGNKSRSMYQNQILGDEYVFYPFGKENDQFQLRKADSAEKDLINNEELQYTLIEKRIVTDSEDGVIFRLVTYIENKSDRYLYVSTQDEASKLTPKINGNEYLGELAGAFMRPHTRIVRYVDFYEKELNDIKAEDILAIELPITVKEKYINEKGKIASNLIYQDTFMLNTDEIR